MVRLQMPFQNLAFLLPGQSMKNFPEVEAEASDLFNKWLKPVSTAQPTLRSFIRPRTDICWRREVAYATDEDRRHALWRTGGDHCCRTRMPCANAWRSPGEGAGHG